MRLNTELSHANKAVANMREALDDAANSAVDGDGGDGLGGDAAATHRKNPPDGGPAAAAAGSGRGASTSASASASASNGGAVPVKPSGPTDCKRLVSSTLSL
jgi:hypothetical protein